MNDQFIHRDLKIVEPKFSSPLTDLIIDLDYLRKKRLGGSTHPVVFFQLKRIFHTLESVGSARIEGNNTTVAEYIETKLNGDATITEPVREINNMEVALERIDAGWKDHPINRDLLCELHKLAVDQLSPPPYGEGDRTPGVYRDKPVSVRGAQFRPPRPEDVQWYMDDLYEFLNKKEDRKYDLLKIALAHHRFVWVHPFFNGNGRTGRLFTYVLLTKSGFNVNEGHILNPAAVFCGNRKEYYRQLALADTGSDEGILSWCEYALSGLKNEIEKIDRLLDYEYLCKEILLPALKISLERGIITATESHILHKAVEKQAIKAGDLKDIFKGKLPQEISRQLANLKKKEMLMPEPGMPDQGSKRRYYMRFSNNYLLRGIIAMLGKKGFLPDQPMRP